MEAIYQKYEAYGFIAISTWGEDSGRDTPDQADLQAGAKYFGLTVPIVADPDWDTLQTYTSGHPNRMLLGPGAEIIRIGGTVSDAAIQAVLPTTYP